MDDIGDDSETLYQFGINNLPDEILEYILGLLRPYSDLNECMLVCKRWNRSALRVLKYKKSNFNKCVANFNIKWEHCTPPEKGHTISKRYSHSACSYENSMYVFGGCTCTSTTFNDLWRLDLSTRQWYRLLTMGHYPTPKALATLVHYQATLVLFGGWTHPTPFPLHQAWRTFNELHIYDIGANRWDCVITPVLSPPPMAGHSASVHGDDMVVFGGICGHMVTGSANDIWCYNFFSQSWRNQQTTTPRPLARYNQSQIAIDEDHLLIIGGCGGRPNVLLNDVWLLTMQGPFWEWRELAVENPLWGTSHPSNGQIWCHPACKSGTNVIAVGRNPKPTISTFLLPKWKLVHRPQSVDDLPRRASDGCVSPAVDRDVNVNGRRGVLSTRQGNAEQFIPPLPVAEPVANSQDQNNVNAETARVNEPRSSSGERVRNQSPYRTNRNMNLQMHNNMAAFRSSPTNFGNKQRERQLEVLNRMEERLRNRSPKPRPPEKPAPPVAKQSPPKMAMFVMDITNVLTDLSVKWLPIKNVASGGPEHTILYSLVPGQGEIIMFGGIEKDICVFSIDEMNVNVINTVTNNLHFITAPHTVV